jgi:hypothetical protein
MNMFDLRNKKSQMKSASIGMEFDYSDPNIAYLGGGGASSQSTQDSIIQSTNPIAALQAGNIQANAANQASQLYSSSINDAIQTLNNQYNKASYMVQPYQLTGIAALDQLNQYLGLPAYNPGPAPLSMQQRAEGYANPDKVKQQILSELTPNNPMSPFVNYTASPYQPGPFSGVSQLQAAQGSGVQGLPQGQTTGQMGGYGFPGFVPSYNYTGPGVEDMLNQYQTPDNPKSLEQVAQEQGIPFDQFMALRNAQIQSNTIGAVYNPNYVTSNSAIQNANKQQLMNQYLQDPNNQQAYQQDLTGYNQNKSLYDQYTAQGPMTQAQITENIANQPGYQAELGQGINAIASDASAKGYLGSGKILKELSNFGQNTFSNYYGNVLKNLSNLVGQGAQTATSLSGAAQNQGNSLANLMTSLGSNQANAALAGGNSQAQSLINAGQQYNVVQTGQSSSKQEGQSGIGSILSGIGSIAGAFGGL